MDTLDVGPRLRSLRRSRRLTLARLAALTGLTESTLSRLENGRLQPTLAQLMPLARGYGLGLDALVGLTTSQSEGVLHKHGAVYTPLSRHAGGIRTYKMTSPRRETLLEPEPRTHQGFHWLYVLNGRLRVVLGERDFVLKSGEAAEFDTGVPHWMGHADLNPIEALVLFGPEGQRARVMARTRAIVRTHTP